MKKINKVAYKLTIDKIKTKEDFCDFLLFSVKTINIIFNNESIIASQSDEDLDIIFIKLKEKISEWISESIHTQPFYPRNFIKKILKSGSQINFIDRMDNQDKMKPEDYAINNSNDMKNFLLSRIDKNNEVNGLKFKNNKMQINANEMPLDVYNAIMFNYTLMKNTRVYIKFKVDKNFEDVFFYINFISIHDDEVQP